MEFDKEYFVRRLKESIENSCSLPSDILFENYKYVLNTYKENMQEFSEDEKEIVNRYLEITHDNLQEKLKKFISNIKCHTKDTF